MGEGRLIKDEEVRCGRKDIVDEDTEQPAIDMSELAHCDYSVVTYHVIRYNVNNCLRQSSRGHALSYAAWEGRTEKYLDAGSYCHVAGGKAKPVGSSFMLEKVALVANDNVLAGRRLE